MKYAALDIAYYIIDKCTKDLKPITNLQLQKILYYVFREFLKNGRVLFDDRIEAWQFGPVVPNVYLEFCMFSSIPIRMYYNVEIDDDDAKIIDQIVLEKRELDPWDMVNDTHKQGKAWSSVYDNGRGNKKRIPVELIRQRG